MSNPFHILGGHNSPIIRSKTLKMNATPLVCHINYSFDMLYSKSTRPLPKLTQKHVILGVTCFLMGQTSVPGGQVVDSEGGTS